MSFRSCATPTIHCGPATAEASCAPQRFDTADPAWNGAFAGLTFTGGADPLGWLSERPWLWSLLRDAVVALRESARRELQVEPSFTVEAQWLGEHEPTVRLLVSVPVFPYVYPGYEPFVSDREIDFLLGPEGGPRATHGDAVATLEHPSFDGHPVGGINVSIRLMADAPDAAPKPPASMVTRSVKLSTTISGDFPEVQDLAAEIHRTIGSAIERERGEEFQRAIDGGA